MHTKDFTALTADLRALGGRRVWSLMISLFGDLAQAKGQSIDGPLLSAIMAHLQVKPEAARVALHRLRNDGWIVSEKSGRISQHSLTAKGRAECATASPRIYAEPDLVATEWQLVLTKDNTPAQIEDLTGRGFSHLMPRLFVGPPDAQAPTDALGLPAGTAPDWLRRQIEPNSQDNSYAALLLTLEDLQTGLPEPDALTPIEVAVIRCLIVHNWRRLVLKQPNLPAPLIDPSGPSHQCHLHVAQLLAELKRPTLSDIAHWRAAA